MPENFENLECWQACYKLKNYLRNNILSKFPKTERFELYSQLLRASRSATANIAEGWGRYHYRDSIKFFLNARGSVSEIIDHSIEAKDWDYISDEELKEIKEQANSCLRLINVFINYLRKQMDGK